MNRLANVVGCLNLRTDKMTAGIPVCFGSGVCLEKPIGKCVRGIHDVCEHHDASCYLCREHDAISMLQAEWPKRKTFSGVLT